MVGAGSRGGWVGGLVWSKAVTDRQEGKDMVGMVGMIGVISSLNQILIATWSCGIFQQPKSGCQV